MWLHNGFPYPLVNTKLEVSQRKTNWTFISLKLLLQLLSQQWDAIKKPLVDPSSQLQTYLGQAHSAGYICSLVDSLISIVHQYI